jgi:hypothetical protein
MIFFTWYFGNDYIIFYFFYFFYLDHFLEILFGNGGIVVGVGGEIGGWIGNFISWKFYLLYSFAWRIWQFKHCLWRYFI